MVVYFTAVSAIVPSILLIWYFHSRDENPEPAGVLWATFLLGVATVIPVLMVALPISHVLEASVRDPYANGFLDAFLVAAGPEEFFKFLVVTLYCARHKEFDEPMDGIVYGALASLGFATLENILYVAQGGIGLAVLRALTAVPGHAFMGALMGYFVGQAKFRPNNSWMYFLAGYFVPFFLHGFYDFPLLVVKQLTEARQEVDAAAPLLIITFVVLLFEWIWVVRIVNRLRAEQLTARSQMPQQGFQPGFSPGYAPAPAMQTYGQPMQQAPVPNYYGAAPTYGQAPPVAAPSGGTFGSLFMMLVGGVLASGGGIISLGIIAAVVMGATEEGTVGELLIGGTIIGILPLFLGFFLFARGIRRLSRG